MSVLTIELSNHFRSVGKVGSRFPSPFTDFVTVPINMILQFLLVDERIRISDTSNSSLPTISIGRGGACSRSRMIDSLYGLNKEI